MLLSRIQIHIFTYKCIIKLYFLIYLYKQTLNKIFIYDKLKYNFFNIILHKEGNMKQFFKLFLFIVLSFNLVACSSNSADKLYKIQIAGVDVEVGKTKAEIFRDCNYTLDADLDQTLHGNSYYRSVSILDENGDSVGWVNLYSKEETVLTDAIIAEVYVLHPSADFTFEGVKTADITLEKAKELLPGAKSSEDSVWSPIGDYCTRLTFDTNGTLKDLEHYKYYKVDYSK